MNILQVIPQLNVGGTETGVLDFSKFLVDNGHKAVVISAGGILVDELTALGVKHYELPVHEKNILTIFLTVKKIARIIKEEDIDIVHARSRVPAWITFFATRLVNKDSLKRVLFVTTCHGHYSNKFTSRVMSWGRRVIVASNAIGRYMVDAFGTPYERIRLIPRGVDIDKYTFKDPTLKERTEFAIGMIGRITPLKGHEYFIKSIYSVIRHLPNIRVLIVGDTPRSKRYLLRELGVLTRRLGLVDYVQFLGRRDDIPDILAHLNLLVVSTVEEEAFGRVIIEAQACGVPVVATAVGGIVDIIKDGESGILVPPRDTEAMAQAIVKTLRDVKLSRKIAANAHSLVKEKFTLKLMAQKTLEVYKEIIEENNILIIKFSAIGDIILITPALRAIRSKFPKAKISLLTSDIGHEILKNCPYVDEVLIYDYKKMHKKISAIFYFAKIIRKKCFDLVVDLQNNQRSHILSFLSFANKTIGFDNKKLSFLLSNRVKLPKDKLQPVEHQFKLLESIGIEKDSNFKLELWPSKEDAAYVDELLGSNWIVKEQKIVGINIGASWETKRLTPKQIVKICEMLAAKDIRVLLTGLEGDIKTADLITANLTVSPINFCGKTTLNQLACLLKKCNCFISSDSAPLHIAAAMEIPIVAVFGPTDYLRHVPPNRNLKVVSKKLDCSPCYKAKCKKRECIEKISAEEIVSAAYELLDKK